MTFALLFALAVAPLSSVAQDTAAERRAAEAAERGDCTIALRELRPVLAAPTSAATRAPSAPALVLAMECELQLENLDAAYPLAVRASRLEPPSPEAWKYRLGYELDRGRFGDAVATIEALNQGDGAILNAIDIRWLWNLDSRLKSGNLGDLRRRFLAAVAFSYSPDRIDGNADQFRLDFARLSIKDGRREPAMAALTGITTPSVMREVLLDRDLRKTLSPGTSIKDLTERQLVENRALIASHPDRLSPILDVATDLRDLGRADEALRLLVSVRTRVEKSDFADIDQFRPWWWDGLSRAQRMLGQTDAAIASLRSGMMTKEQGGQNISQVINLMWLQNRLARPQAALDTLATAEPLGNASPYGEMQLRLERGCAYEQLGRTAEASAQLAYMAAHQLDAPGDYGDLLLCMGDLDKAAADTIARLSNVETRADVVADYSRYARPPVVLPQSVIDRNRAKLALRADVRKALADAGGPVTFDVQKEGF